MLRLATQKRRLKSKVQELSDDDVILEVAPRAEALPPRSIESRSCIVAFPSYAHDAPTSTFIGRIDTWKLPPPPRIPVLASFLARSPSHSDSSVPPVAMPAAIISPPRKPAALTSAAATQKIRATLGEITEHTLVIVQGRPSIGWAAALLTIGICVGAFLARPGRNELAAEAAHEGAHELAPAHAAQESAAPEIIMAAATTRAPTVSEVPPPPVVILAAPPALAPVQIAPAKIITAKKLLVKNAAPSPTVATAPSARSAKDADALAREQLKSALR